MSAAEQLSATRTIPARASEVFAVLADPVRHPETEPGDWVRRAIEPELITAEGQVFGMDMFLELAGGAYVMHNRVTVFERDRAIGWAPGVRQDDGQLDLGGWWWRYDLAPADEGTEVTLTYDWTETPDSFRRQVGGMPPFGPDFLEQSLASLEAAVLRTA